MSKSVPMPYTRRVRSGGATKKVLVFPSDPNYRQSRPPRKKKAVRKPKPFKLGPWVIAYCAVERYRTRAVVFVQRLQWNLMARNGWEITGYSRWLLRAAAWVEGGRR